MKWELIRQGENGWTYVLPICKWRKDMTKGYDIEYLDILPCWNVQGAPGWALTRKGIKEDLLALWTNQGNLAWIAPDFTWAEIGLNENDLEEIENRLKSV